MSERLRYLLTIEHEPSCERDRIDSGRATAPLTMADGAVHIDTTDYSLDEVIAQVVTLVEAVETSA